ncbi:MAG: CpsD/CapB family tyrosine-protein kinase, partial [Pseudomonadota bacterium]
LTRSKETAQTGLEQADARIISRASVPHKPSYPDRLLLLGIALIGSIAISGSLVGAAETLEKGYRDGDRIRRDLSLPTVGEVPWVSTPPGDGMIADLPVDDPAGALAESLRTTALALELFGPPGDRGNILLITSSVPAEGKTTIITCLGRTLALAGRKVLVIDADLRRPNCHHQMHLEQRPGLTSYLSNQRSLEEIIQQDETTGVDLIAAGEVPKNPLKLLRSAELARLLREMRPRYDVILIDSPPLLPIADTRLLSAIADRSVLIVQWRVTPRESVQRAVEQLEQAGGRPDGIILTQLRERADHGYGYYYASYRAALEKEQAL